METTPKSKWLGHPAEWLLQTGLLGEINRLVLHPRGMALSVNQSNDGSVTFGVIYDYREDPEGMDYSPEDIQLIANKLASAEAAGIIPDGCNPVRFKIYPDGIQPLPVPNYIGYGDDDEEPSP